MATAEEIAQQESLTNLVGGGIQTGLGIVQNITSGDRAEDLRNQALDAAFPKEMQDFQRQLFEMLGQEGVGRLFGQDETAFIGDNRSIDPETLRNLQQLVQGQLTDPALSGQTDIAEAFHTAGLDDIIAGTDFSSGTGFQSLLDSINQTGGQKSFEGLFQQQDLNQLMQDPAIADLIQQQMTAFGQQGDQQNLGLGQLQESVQGIGDVTGQSLRDLLQQAGGAGQDLQSLLQGQFENNFQDNTDLDFFLGSARDQSAGQRDISGFDQFRDPLTSLLQNTENLSTQIQQDANDLISANEEQSRFEEEQSIQSLNDQLSARGLSNSSAGLEAITAQQERFSRSRAQDAARIRSDAQRNSISQQLQANQLGGQLAGQGGSLLSQQGQLGNADLNSRLRALGIGGELSKQSGIQGSRDISNSLNILGAGQNQRGEQAGLVNNLNQQGLGQANSLFDLLNRAAGVNVNTNTNRLNLLGNNENRNNLFGQNMLDNQARQFDQVSGLVSGGRAGAGSGSNTAASILSGEASRFSNNAAAGSESTSSGIFKLLQGALSKIKFGTSGQPNPNTGGGGNGLNFNTFDQNFDLQGQGQVAPANNNNFGGGNTLQPLEFDGGNMNPGFLDEFAPQPFDISNTG